MNTANRSMIRESDITLFSQQHGITESKAKEILVFFEGAYRNAIQYQMELLFNAVTQSAADIEYLYRGAKSIRHNMPKSNLCVYSIQICIGFLKKLSNMGISINFVVPFIIVKLNELYAIK